jgi:hypothetical protein
VNLRRTDTRIAPPSSPPSITNASRTYEDPLLGWSIDYPSTMELGRFSSDARFELEGIRLTNFSPDLGAPSSVLPPMGWLRSFPDEGVALHIWGGR